MPDWIIHMGATHACARPLARPDPRWLLLGAVLPDVFPRLIGHTIAVVPPLRSLATPQLELFLSLLHTPFSVALLAGALVALARDRGVAWRGLAFGAALHFALDAMQKSYGGGSCLLYPLLIRPFSLNVVWYDSGIVRALVAVCAVYLAVLAVRSRGATWPPAFRLRPGTGRVAAALLAVWLVTPWLCLDRAVGANLGGSRLAADPRSFEGQPVQLSAVEVREIEGDCIRIEVMQVVFAISRRRLPDLAEGDHVSIDGEYRDGLIHVHRAFVHDYWFKRAVSLVGAALLLLFWLRRTDRSDPAPTSEQ